MRYSITVQAIKQNGYSNWFYETITAKDLPSAFAKACGMAKTLELFDKENGIGRKFIVNTVSPK